MQRVRRKSRPLGRPRREYRRASERGENESGNAEPKFAVHKWHRRPGLVGRSRGRRGEEKSEGEEEKEEKRKGRGKLGGGWEERRYFNGGGRRLIAKITADTRNRLGTTLGTLFTVDTAGWNVCPRGHAGHNIRGQLPPSATYITPHLSGALSFVLASDRGEIFRVARARHPHDSGELDRSDPFRAHRRDPPFSLVAPREDTARNPLGLASSRKTGNPFATGIKSSTRSAARLLAHLAPRYARVAAVTVAARTRTLEACQYRSSCGSNVFAEPPNLRPACLLVTRSRSNFSSARAKRNTPLSEPRGRTDSARGDKQPPKGAAGGVVQPWPAL